MFKYRINIIEGARVLNPQLTRYNPVILDWIAESTNHYFRTRLIQVSAVGGRAVILEEVCS